MCGIVGIATQNGSRPVHLDLVQRMAASILHRGPDDQGIYAGTQAVIGMRRLAIIDLTSGQQPIGNEDHTLWLVCNGEIYNHRELRKHLEQRGHRFRTGSDVEVLLHLYEEHGEAFLDAVSGMFAFALWDQRRERLILGRDRLGIKPLYYTQVDGDMAFASEIKALIQLPGMRMGLDVNGLREYLALGYCVAPNTILRNVLKLPPATLLVWSRAGSRIVRYWQPPADTDERLGEQEWCERIRWELERSVAEHMISDVPIGAFLSGGVDSSAIVAYMARNSSQPVNSYSIGYSGGAAEKYYNELAYAAEFASLFQTNHREIVVKPEMSSLLPQLLWHLEEPISDSSVTATYLVSQLAARDVKVILSGVGGDELFAGYKRYLGESYTRRYQRLPGWLRHRVVGPLARLLPSGRQSRIMDFGRYAKRFVQSSELDWRSQYRQYVEIQSRGLLASLMMESPGGADGFDRVLAAESSADPLQRLMRVDCATQLPEDLLLLTDKATMAQSIECRVPFLDHRLVELAARIPYRLKLRDGELKSLLKRALTDVVPASVLKRGKRGFGAPVGSWFKQQLRPMRRSLVNREVIERRGILNWAVVEQVVAAHDANREDYSDLTLVLVNLEIWCRIFLDGQSPAEVSQELSQSRLAA
jgi:asparagine synthase (glutamine-hydrolysing)